MKIDETKRCDWEKRTPPADMYPCIITGYKVDVNGMPRMYHDITDGDYEGIYGGVGGIQSFNNSVLYTNKDAAMLDKRLAALEASNPGFDAVKAYEEDDWGAFIGKKCVVTYKQKYKDAQGRYHLEQDEEGTRKPVVVTDAVLPLSAYYQDDPEPVRDAPAVVVAPPIGSPDIDVDYRQRQGHHDVKHAALRAAGWRLHEGEQLKTADYVQDGNKYVVETKGDLDEIAGNLDNNRVGLFAEMQRAKENGWEMLVLITEPGMYGPEDVLAWTPAGCKTCMRCKPQDMNTNCTEHGEKPLCGMPLLAALEDLAKECRQVRFVGNESKAAAVIAWWMNWGWM